MTALEVMEVAYKYMRYYTSHLPTTVEEMEKAAERAKEIAGDDPFAIKIMVDCLKEIEREVADGRVQK